MKRSRDEFNKLGESFTLPEALRFRSSGMDKAVTMESGPVKILHIPLTQKSSQNTQRSFIPSWISKPFTTQSKPQSHSNASDTRSRYRITHGVNRSYICKIPEDYFHEDQIIDPSPSPDETVPPNTSNGVANIDSGCRKHESSGAFKMIPSASLRQHAFASDKDPSNNVNGHQLSTKYDDNLVYEENYEYPANEQLHWEPSPSRNVPQIHTTNDGTYNMKINTDKRGDLNNFPGDQKLLTIKSNVKVNQNDHSNPLYHFSDDGPLDEDALLDMYLANFEMEPAISSNNTAPCCISIDSHGKAESALNTDDDKRYVKHQAEVGFEGDNNNTKTHIAYVDVNSQKLNVRIDELSVAKELKSAINKKDIGAISLGSWYFDKRAKKRKYLALTGKVYVGSEAMRRCQLDQYNEQHPAIRLRTDLKTGCQFASVTRRLALLYREFSLIPNSCTATDSKENHLLTMLSTWGLPEKLVNKYKMHKIQKLFPWQIDCLMTNQGNVLDGKENLVYSAPTSGGKTLVAEILMLRRLAQTMLIGDPKKQLAQMSDQVQRKTIFFVVPFIALAEEKACYFQDIWADMNVGIRAYHQDNGLDNTLGKEVEVVICTIERANILLNQLLDEHREAQLSMIVIDEVHLLSDPQRGFLLEVMLSKVKYLQEAKMFPHHVQIVGMSATLPNIQELASWLHASLYVTDYRPVNLDMFACMNRKIFRCKVQQNHNQGPKHLPGIEKIDGNCVDLVQHTDKAISIAPETSFEFNKIAESGDVHSIHDVEEELKCIPSRRHLIHDLSSNYVPSTSTLPEAKIGIDATAPEKFVPTTASLPRRPSASVLSNGLKISHNSTLESVRSYEVDRQSDLSLNHGNDFLSSIVKDRQEHSDPQRSILAPIPPSKPKGIEIIPASMDGLSNQRPQLAHRNVPNTIGGLSEYHNGAPMPSTITTQVPQNSMQGYNSFQMFYETAEALRVPGAHIHVPSVLSNDFNAVHTGGGIPPITINVFNNYYFCPSDFNADNVNGRNTRSLTGFESIPSDSNSFIAAHRAQPMGSTTSLPLQHNSGHNSSKTQPPLRSMAASRSLLEQVQAASSATRTSSSLTVKSIDSNQPLAMIPEELFEDAGYRSDATLPPALIMPDLKSEPIIDDTKEGLTSVESNFPPAKTRAEYIKVPNADVFCEYNTVDKESTISARTVEYECLRDLPFDNIAGGSTLMTASSMINNGSNNQPQIDGFRALCIETIEEGKSALIFLNSKRRCESSAKIICEVLHWYRSTVHSQSMTGIQPIMMRPILQGANRPQQQHIHDLFSASSIQQKRMHLIDELSQTPVGLCPILRETIVFGVAYHHAGLTHDERKLIEDGFRKGILQILCTTSTLSAGVNLPANRVIIRSLQMADQLISVATFRQMCGRAGRTGFDKQGEAIIMLDNGNDKVDGRLRHHCDYLLTSELDPLRSSLHLGNGGGLEKLLLEMITCGRLVKEQEVLNFVSCTLMNVQLPQEQVFELVKNAVIFLKQGGFIQLSTQGVLVPSALGKATMLSGIAPKDAVEILPSLLQARSKLLLHHGNAGLHPIFLVTPPCTLAPQYISPVNKSNSNGPQTNSSSLSHYSGSTGGIEPDWDNFEKLVDLLMKDYPEIKQLLACLNIEHAHLLACKFNKPSIQSDRYKLYKRLYNAILLFTLIQEWPLNKILSFTSLASSNGNGNRGSSSTTSSSSRGQLQQLLKDASAFCGMVIVFCKKLNWPMLVSCFEELNTRLSYGVASKDVLPLVRIGSDVMSVTRARAFVKQEIKTPYDVVSVGAERLAQILVDSLPFHERNALEMLHGNLAVGSNDKRRCNGDMSESMKTPKMNNGKIFHAYLRLAKKIIQRANEHIQDELRRKQLPLY